MTSVRKTERGFSVVEGTLLVVIVATIGIVGSYVYSHRSKPASNTVSSVASTPQTNALAQPLSSGTSNADLQTDLNNVTGSSSQTNTDITNTNAALNDQSTMTSIPQ